MISPRSISLQLLNFSEDRGWKMSKKSKNMYIRLIFSFLEELLHDGVVFSTLTARSPKFESQQGSF